MMTFCSSGQHVFLLLPHTYLSFLQISPDDLLLDSLMKISNHPYTSVFHVVNVLLPLSLICYFFIHYFCPFLISVRIFCIMQFIVLMIQSLLIFVAPSSFLTELANLLCPLVCLPVSSLYFSTLIFQLAVFSLTLSSWHEWLLFFSRSLCFRSLFSSGIYNSWIFRAVLPFLFRHVLKSPFKSWCYVPMATVASDSVTKASTELILQCFSCLPYHIKMGELNFLVWWLITLH